MTNWNAKRQLDRIYQRDKGICQHCMEPCTREDASRGHIIDVEYCDHKMANDDNNMQLEHTWCNEEKGREKQLERSELLRNLSEPEPLNFTIGDQLSGIFPSTDTSTCE